MMNKQVVSAVASVAVLSLSYAGVASASTYTVQKGDTLSHIAIKFKTSVPDLKKLNNLSSDFLQVNQVLKVTSDDSTVAPVAPAVTPTLTYTVVSGDSLSKIASRFGISVSDLMQWNNLGNTLIYPGNQLKISFSSAPAVTTPPPATPAPAPESVSEYIIKSGDTLGALALKFGTTVADLKKQNGLTSDLIFVGQKLKVSAETVSAVKPVPDSPSTSAPVQPSPAPDATKTTDYVVVSGDTLSRIAAQFDTSISSIKKLNNLTSDLIYVGQKLKVESQSVTTSSPGALTNLASAVIREAKALMGVPYVWGGSSSTGFDCSGFIYYVFNKAGFTTSRYNAEGFYSRSYYVNQPQPGDLVFFENTYKEGISHVGIYLGDNQFIHADETKGIAITSLSSSYFQAHFDGFKRFY